MLHRNLWWLGNGVQNTVLRAIIFQYLCKGLFEVTDLVPEFLMGSMWQTYMKSGKQGEYWRTEIFLKSLLDKVRKEDLALSLVEQYLE